MILTPIAPVKITMAPTDRSMLPIMTTKVLPRQAIDRLAVWRLKAVTLRMVAKEGVSTEKKTISAKTTNPGSQKPFRDAVGRAPRAGVGRTAVDRLTTTWRMPRPFSCCTVLDDDRPGFLASSRRQGLVRSAWRGAARGSPSRPGRAG